MASTSIPAPRRHPEDGEYSTGGDWWGSAGALLGLLSSGLVLGGLAWWLQ